MAGETNEVSIAFEAELGRFDAGIKKAEAMLKQSGTRLEAIAKDNSRKISRAMSQGFVTRSFQPYGVSGDSSFGGGAASAGMAAMAAQAEATKKPLAEISRLTALAGRAIAAANIATYTWRTSAALVKGEYDGISDAIRSAPFGIGEAVGLMEDWLNYALGIDAALHSESAGQRRRAMLEIDQKAAIVHKATMEAMGKRLEAESAISEEARIRLSQEAELLELKARYEKIGGDAEIAGASAKEHARINSLYDMEYRIATETHKRINREAAEDRAKREAEALWQANAEAAKLIENNRRNERQKRYRERSDEIRNEVRELREAESKMREELQAAQGVTGSNFVRSISTAMGQFSFGQAGGAQEVGRAQIKSAELLAKINDNTKAMLELEKERDWIGTLR